MVDTNFNFGGQKFCTGKSIYSMVSISLAAINTNIVQAPSILRLNLEVICIIQAAPLHHQPAVASHMATFGTITTSLASH